MNKRRITIEDTVDGINTLNVVTVDLTSDDDMLFRVLSDGRIILVVSDFASEQFARLIGTFAGRDQPRRP